MLDTQCLQQPHKKDAIMIRILQMKTRGSAVLGRLPKVTRHLVLEPTLNSIVRWKIPAKIWRISISRLKNLHKSTVLLKLIGYLGLASISTRRNQNQSTKTCLGTMETRLFLQRSNISYVTDIRENHARKQLFQCAMPSLKTEDEGILLPFPSKSSHK